MPKISVVMPVLNGEKYIKQSIESILVQTFKDFEFIIINDASEDNTEKIILSFNDDRIRYYKNEENIGIPRSLNKGIQLVKGKYIARMDADDISLPNRFEEQFNYLENNYDIALVGSWVEFIDENGNKKNIWKVPSDFLLIKFFLLSGNCLAHSSIFFRKSFIDKIGGYNNDFKYSQDYELYLRMLSDFKLYNIPKVLLQYRHGVFDGYRRKQQIELARNILSNYIKFYAKLSHEEFDAYFKILFNTSSSFYHLLKFLKVYKNIMNNFIERENLNEKNKKLIKIKYIKIRNNIIKKYIKNLII